MGSDRQRAVMRRVALGSLLCWLFSFGSCYAGQCKISMQPHNFVFSKHGESNASVAGECFGDEDYHPFSTEPYKIRSGWVREMSGIARSGLEDEIFWGHNDGKANDIFAMRLGNTESLDKYKYRHQPGDIIARAFLPTKVERQTDWEDIDTGLCPDESGRSCLWIADTGDNSKRRNRPRIHVVVEPDLDLEHHYAGSDKFYDIHVCDEDAWTFQFEFEYEEDDEWIEGGSFDIEAMAVAPEGNKVWMFEKKQHWEKKVWGWPRVFESESITEALRSAGKDRFIQIKVREITKIPRPCEVAPEAWEWLAKPENLFFGRSIIENEKIATNVYKYKKMHEYGHRDGLVDMFTNGTDCTKFPPIFWMITGANLHPSGKRLAIQTYSGAFEYVFSTPLNFEELPNIKPRQLGLPRFDQVESIVYGHDGKSLFAIPEALGRKGWQKVEQILCKKKAKLDEESAEEQEEEETTTTAAEEIVQKEKNNTTAIEIAIRSLEIGEEAKEAVDDDIPLARKNNIFGSFLNDALHEMDDMESSVPNDKEENTTAAEVDFIVLDSPSFDGTQLKAHANAAIHSEAEDRSMVISFLDRVVPTTDQEEEEEEAGDPEDKKPHTQSVRSANPEKPDLIGNERIMGATLVLELMEEGE